MPELYFYGGSGIFLLLPLSYVLYRDIINHNVEKNQKWLGGYSGLCFAVSENFVSV